MAFKWFKKKKEDSESTQESGLEAAAEQAGEEPAGEPVSAAEPPAGEIDALADEPETDASPAPEEPADETDGDQKGRGLFSRLKSGLSKTRKILTTDIDELFLGKKIVDDDMIEDLEELLITSDMGVQTTMEIMERIAGKRSRISGAGELKRVLKEEILAYF